MWPVVSGTAIVGPWLLMIVPFTVLGIYAWFPKRVR